MFALAVVKGVARSLPCAGVVSAASPGVGAGRFAPRLFCRRFSRRRRRLGAVPLRFRCSLWPAVGRRSSFGRDLRRKSAALPGQLLALAGGWATLVVRPGFAPQVCGATRPTPRSGRRLGVARRSAGV